MTDRNCENKTEYIALIILRIRSTFMASGFRKRHKCLDFIMMKNLLQQNYYS